MPLQKTFYKKPIKNLKRDLRTNTERTSHSEMKFLKENINKPIGSGGTNS